MTPIPEGYRRFYEFENLEDGLYALTDRGFLWGPLRAEVSRAIDRQRLVKKLAVDEVDTPRSPLVRKSSRVWLESPAKTPVNWGNQ